MAQLDGREAELADADAFAGYTGDPIAPASIVLTHHGLGIELVIDHSPNLRRDPDAPRPRLIVRAITPALIVVALFVGVFVSEIGLWAMFVTALAGPIARRMDRH